MHFYALHSAGQPLSYALSMGERLWTEQELADYCHVHVTTVRRWRRNGTGPPVHWAGNKPRYRRSEVDAWLDRHPDPGSEERPCGE
jgi:excisionase family DNA binding protein